MRVTSRAELALLVREAALRIVLLALRPFDVLPSRPRQARHTIGGVPVLLVPDLRRSQSSTVFLRTFLEHRGWSWVWAARPRRRATLSQHAEAVGAAVEVLAQASGTETVDLVAHGTGGLAAAWYVRHLGGDRRVRRLVTLGTPWQGTRTSVFHGDRLALETRWRAVELDPLVPPPVPAVCIWSPVDPFVVPAASALPDGVEGVRIEAAGHLDMITSPRVLRAVQAALSHPIPGAGA